MKIDIKKLRTLITLPRLSRKSLLFLVILTAIFAGALYLRLSVTFGWRLALGRDGPYHLFHVNYLLEHWPSLHSGVGATHQLFFYFAAGIHGLLSIFGASLIASFNIGTSLASALVVPMTFLMVRRLAKNSVTALVAAFFSGFVPASFRMFGELQKNTLGVSLTPLAVLFFWRGIGGKRKLDLFLAGVVLGTVGLTHELAFGTLCIAYVSYLALLLAHRRRIPWHEIKCMTVTAVFTVIVCGYFYAQSLGAIESMAGEKEVGPPPGGPFLSGEFQATGITAQELPPVNELPQRLPPREERSVYQFYDEYIGQPLFIFAAFGAGVCIYRRKPADFFLLAWVMSALAMAQTWVAPGYQWRFPLMLATPVVLLAAVGLVEGIGAFLWKLGGSIRTFPDNLKKNITVLGRAVFLLLLFAILVHQTRVSHTYAWTGDMLQPTISIEQYDALVNFYEEFGSIYAFRIEGYPIYWPDAVGLKSDIAGAKVISNLSEMSRRAPALDLASEWHRKQDEANARIYGLAIRPAAGVLKNEEFFEVVFNRPGLWVYALRENFSPPPVSSETFTSPSANGDELFFERRPPGEMEPVHLKILLAPVYALRGWQRFILGVPLTVFMWVFLLCLGWELIRKMADPELVRKLFVLTLVCVFALVSVALVRGYQQRPELGPPPEGTPPPEEQQPPPGGEEHFSGPLALFGGIIHRSAPKPIFGVMSARE